MTAVDTSADSAAGQGRVVLEARSLVKDFRTNKRKGLFGREHFRAVDDVSSSCAPARSLRWSVRAVLVRARWGGCWRS